MSLGSVEVSWAVLARLGRVLDVHWERLGASEVISEASWGHLGASRVDIGRVLGGLGSFLGGFWEYFLDDFLQFQAICERKRLCLLCV